MQITWNHREHPIERLTLLSSAGDTLSVGWIVASGATGAGDYDLSALATDGSLDGATLGCPLITGTITRPGGVITMTIDLPHDFDVPADTLALTGLTLSGAATIPPVIGTRMVGPVPTSLALPDPYDPTLL